MDIRNLIRPIIAGLVGLGIIVLLIVLIVKLFSGHGSAPASQVDLGKYQDTAAVASVLIDEPTNVDQDHHQVKITVTQTQNEIDIIKGYQGDVTATRTYPNNSAAFGAFLQALKQYDFSSGDKSSEDYRGFCPTGNRYVYTFNDGSKDLFSYWSTNCRQGTFKGNADGVLELFQAQIPEQDYDDLTSDITTGF